MAAAGVGRMVALADRCNGGRMKVRTRVAGKLLLLVGLILGANAWAAPPTQAVRAKAKEELRETLQASADSAHGGHLFSICAECHGAHGEGNANGWPPQIAGQHARVVAKELVDFRTGLRWYDPMERIAGRHVLQRVQDIADVAAYVAALPPSSATTPGPGRALQQGARLYAQRCEWCHGAQGEGNDERFVPRVAGQQYEYLLRQLQDARAGRRPSMQAQHPRLIASCSMDDLAGLADYMARLGGAAQQ
jgi:cytochrome c553